MATRDRPAISVAKLAVAAVTLMGLAAPHHAACASDIYKGKTVRIVVGYSPGGGYDAYARMIAPIWSSSSAPR
jgi:tripartite-type tricarboxylate transporter receptor subunit TctC